MVSKTRVEIKKKPERKAPPQKMELKSYYVPEIGLFRVQYKGAGQVPVELNGQYTTSVLANNAIKTYILLRKRK